MRKLLLITLFLMLPFQNFALAENPGEEAASILKKAGEVSGDPAALRELLTRADAIVERAPSDHKMHFARGYLRSRLGDRDGAIAAYRKAVELDPGMAEAHYNLGNLLVSSGRMEEGIAEFDTAFRLNPKDADAPYNAAQALYLLGRFEEALSKWNAAKKLVPDDFQTARKILQALNALGRDAEAAVAREDVLRIRREGKDPAARDASEFCFDQFVVDGRRIFAYEPFVQSPGAPVYLFRVNDSKGRHVGTIDFVGASDGGFLLRVSIPVDDAASRKFTKRLPWGELKSAVEAITRERFAGGK